MGTTSPSRARLLLMTLLIVACGGDEGDQDVAQEFVGETVKLDPSAVVIGQTIYVPAYSHIYSASRDRWSDLTVTLSVRNTDLSKPIILTSVRYYDTDGTALRALVDRSTKLGPMASADFVIDLRDRAGGVGANFVVEWVATEAVTAPIVESVMISTAHAQGISFLSRGEVIASHNAGPSPSLHRE